MCRGISTLCLDWFRLRNSNKVGFWLHRMPSSLSSFLCAVKWVGFANEKEKFPLTLRMTTMSLPHPPRNQRRTEAKHRAPQGPYVVSRDERIAIVTALSLE
jgi:hypothetical protein